MDYESLAGNGNAGNSNFHPAVPMAPSAALHFGPFAPQFSAQVQLDTKVMRVKSDTFLYPFIQNGLRKLAVLPDYKAKLFEIRSNILHHHFYLFRVIIHGQTSLAFSAG